MLTQITSNINNNIKIFGDSIISPITSVTKQIISSKFIISLFGLILIIFIGLYLKKRYKHNCEAIENNYYRDKDEILIGVNYYLYHPSKIRYIFWTGGYDSTFLLIQALIVEGFPVQPIYLKCQNLDTKFGITGRENQDKEIETIKLLRKRILIDFPHLKPMFLPTLYVYSIKKDLNITNNYRNLHKQFGFFSRDITQYERMARFSIHFEKPIEVGLEKCGTGLDFATTGIRKYETTKECQIFNLEELNNLNLLEKINNLNSDNYKDYKNLYIFRNFRFPIVHMSKEDVKQFAARQKLLYLLQMTWTCWYPTEKGNPCNKCPQCSKRINLDNFIK